MIEQQVEYQRLLLALQFYPKNTPEHNVTKISLIEHCKKVFEQICFKSKYN